MMRMGGTDERIVDAALVAITRHVPAGVEVGIPFASDMIDMEDGARAILVMTRRGGWIARSGWVERTRRLDSPLAELWDTSCPGEYDHVTWVDGVEISRDERTYDVLPGATPDPATTRPNPATTPDHGTAP